MDKKPEKLVPEVRFKGFTDDWEQRKGKSIFYSKSNKDFPELIVLSATQDKGMIPRSSTGIDIKYEKKNLRGYKKVEPGDFIVHLRSFQGGFAYSDLTGIVSPAYTVFTFKQPEMFNNYFWKEKFTSYNFIQLLKKVTYGVRDGRSISYSDFLTLNEKFPVKVEQTKIADLFKIIDNLITLQQRKLEQLMQLKKAMLQQLFVDKNCKQPILRFKNFNDNWEERKLSDIANYRNGKAHEQYIDMNGIYTVVNSKFISTNGKVKKFSNKPIELLKKGEIAFVLSDVPNGKALAKAYLIDSDNRYSLNQRIAGITPSSDINSYFLYILINRNRYFLKFDDGVGQTNLSKKDIEEFKENYPLFDEQQKIANLFSKIQILITLQQNKLTQLTTLKEYLLRKLFI